MNTELQILRAALFEWMYNKRYEAFFRTDVRLRIMENKTRRSAQVFVIDDIGTFDPIEVKSLTKKEKKQKKIERLKGLPRRGRYESFIRRS